MEAVCRGSPALAAAPVGSWFWEALTRVLGPRAPGAAEYPGLPAAGPQGVSPPPTFKGRPTLMMVPRLLKLWGAGEGTPVEFEGVGSIAHLGCSTRSTPHPETGSTTFRTSSLLVQRPRSQHSCLQETWSPKGPGPPACLPLTGKQNEIPYNQPVPWNVVIAPVEDFQHD